MGRRIAKTDSFGTTHFTWEGMRLLQESREAQTSTYVYEPGSYVPLARIDGKGVVEPHPAAAHALAGSDAGQGKQASVPTTNPSWSDRFNVGAAANDGRPTHAPAKEDATADVVAGEHAAQVYYFHTQPNGLPEELSDNSGHLVWRAQYSTWGSTVREEWQSFDTAGRPQQQLASQSISLQQNLRMQGQYLDRETGLHYNTFRYYDADLGAFTTPDPIGLDGGLNLHQYAPNPVGWIDPWGWKSKNCNGARPEWKSRRTQSSGDSGLKDHARRHPDMSSKQYLEHGKRNVIEGRILTGGKYPDAKYHVRKVGGDKYGVTITGKNGKILSIDGPKQGGAPLTKQKLDDWLKNSGVTAPKNFWN